MNKALKLAFLTLGIMASMLIIPEFGNAYAQTESPQVLDLESLDVNTVAVVIGVSAFGGLVKTLIPFGRKYRKRLIQIEMAEAEGKPTTLKPLKFQQSFLIAWALSIPMGSIMALMFASSIDGLAFGIGLIANAFLWGLTMNWFTGEATS